MHKICQCHNNWGNESGNCEVGFVSKHPNEQYCDPCKPIATKARVAYNVARYRQRKKQAGYMQDVTNPEWTACWIDRECTCCGVNGVPTFNRFLCIKCWEMYADGDYTLHVNLDGRVTYANYDESPGRVRWYSGKTYHQADLWSLIAECRTGSQWTVRVSERLRKLFKKMGLAEGNCSAY